MKRPARLWLLGIALIGAGMARAQGPADPDVGALERRLAAVESMYQEMLRREAEGRREAERRYADLERKYEALQDRVEAADRPAVPTGRGPETGLAGAGRPASSGTEPARPGRDSEAWRVPQLEGRFDDGFLLQTLDEELQLRFHVLDQTDFKAFAPNDQFPARSGLYIPRVRVYFEGQLTRLYEYEVSLQRSVEGVWDLLDGNLNVRPSEGFQLQFGRMLVPYSYAWYNHLEQYFIVPERALFPLNFGLSRSAGVMAHGDLFHDRLRYAVGGFDGRQAGVADNNTTHDAVGYFNARPFLHSESWPALRFLNVGASGFLGEQVAPGENLPLRTSVQTSENDEAANAASAIFLLFDEDTTGYGGRSGAAAHLAWYHRGWSLEAEMQTGRFGYAKHRPEGLSYGQVPVRGGHVTLGYFVTGEEVEDRSTVVPLRPFRLLSGTFAPGAVEVYGRYSGLRLGESVFTDELANPNLWTNRIGMTDIGFNWYLNRFVKIYFDWQHAMFGSPVLIDPVERKFSRSNDLFWIRCQIYF